MSSRGLLLTVLGELALPHGGAAWTQTLVTLMDELGVREKATRQALSRMEQRGWLERERVGRQTRWVLTDESRDLLASGATRIYEFGQADRAWGGTWVVVLTSVPESDRQTRYRMGTGLGWAGFGSLGQGVWISPWVDDEALAVRLLRDLGIEATTFRAELGHLGSPLALAATAWDLPRLRSEYDRFLGANTAARAGRATAAAALTSIVHEWRRFPLVDPDLPAELLPPNWPKRAAARRFAELRASLRPAASLWWERTQDELDRALARPA